MAKKRRRGNSWVLDWQDASGKRHIKSIGNVSEHIAEARLQKKINELLLGNDSSIKDTIIFRKYATLYLGWYEDTFPDSYETKSGNVLISLEPTFGDLRLDKIITRHVTIFKKWCVTERGNKPSTINRKLNDLRGLLTRAKIDGYLTPNDLRIEDIKIKDSTPPKLYTEDDFYKIIAKDKETAHWWVFLSNTGIRVSEFHALRWENVKPNAIHIISTSEDPTKAGKWRYIPLTQDAKACLQYFDQSSEFLVKRPYEVDSIKQRFRRVCERAGISDHKRGIHCLRHTFCSYLIMSGAAPVTAQKIMGHGDLRVTNKYTHLEPDYLHSEIENFRIGSQDTPKLIDG
jgi:integrase